MSSAVAEPERYNINQYAVPQKRFLMEAYRSPKEKKISF
jgi:hypothetical protein